MLRRSPHEPSPARPAGPRALLLLVLLASASAWTAAHSGWLPPKVQTLPPAVHVQDAEAASERKMKPYTETLAGTQGSFDMVPIPSGLLLRGSPEAEDGRETLEGPQLNVEIPAFWMARLEVSWDEYRQFMLQLDLERERAPIPQDEYADAVSRPTPPYVPMDFGMGTDGYPAISMTQFAARHFTKWLSYRTGRFYRLPTEAEWEYACRAGTQDRFSFTGEQDLPKHAWYRENAERRYHRGGQLTPNPWGLHDMHGNVAEWTLDALATYPSEVAPGDQPHWPEELYPRAVRGGSFTDPPEKLRCAARRGSSPAWKARDPQIPQSIWYHTSARFVGFRVVRPLTPPAVEEWGRYWEPDDEEVAEILAEQQANAW